MMEEIYHKLSTVDLWQLRYAEHTTSVEASEAWLNHGTGKVTISHLLVHDHELARWLQQSTRGAEETLVMRMVYVLVDPANKEMDMSEVTNQMLLKSFGLGLAYGYFQSFVSGVTALPQVKRPHWTRQAYTFSYAPKNAAIWSYTRYRPPSRSEGVVQGLVFVRKAVTRIPRIPRILTSCWRRTSSRLFGSI